MKSNQESNPEPLKLEDLVSCEEKDHLELQVADVMPALQNIDITI